MPHLVLDYSANLDSKVDMSALAVRLEDVILETGLFELGAVRVRAHRAEAYAIADRLPENAYLDMVLRIGTGRSESDRKRVGDALFAAAGEFLKDLLAGPHFALSLEVREIDPAFSWKKNSIHPRLRGT